MTATRRGVLAAAVAVGAGVVSLLVDTWKPLRAATQRTAATPDPVLPRPQDLRRDGERVRRERRPLLLFFSTPGCPFCREVRRGYLAPRAAQTEADVLIREVDITSDRSFVGVDGAMQREADLAEALKVRLVPAVRLVDDKLAPLAAPLVGWNDAGFYEGYLQTAIDEAKGKLASR